MCVCVCVCQLQVEDDQGVSLGLESSLTLRRLLVWTYDPKIRLKTLAALVDFCQGLWRENTCEVLCEALQGIDGLRY